MLSNTTDNEDLGKLLSKPWATPKTWAEIKLTDAELIEIDPLPSTVGSTAAEEYAKFKAGKDSK